MEKKKDFEDIYIENFRRLISHAQRHFGISFEDAEDLAQSALERALKNYDSFEPYNDKSEFSWLKTILNNLFVDTIRSKKRVPFQKETNLSGDVSQIDNIPCSSAEKSLDYVEFAQYSHDLLRSSGLTPYEMKIFTCRIIHDMPPKEIAELVERSPANVSRTLYRALQKLKVSKTLEHSQMSVFPS